MWSEDTVNYKDEDGYAYPPVSMFDVYLLAYVPFVFMGVTMLIGACHV